MNGSNALAFVLLIVIVFSLYELATIWLNVREIRRLRDIRYRSLTQKEFGLARHQLLKLAGEKELESDSITFLFFYMLDTKVMRNPDKYKELAKIMREGLFNSSAVKKSNVSDFLDKESANWSPEVKEMVVTNISAINSLMILHSPLLRIVFGIARILLPLVKKRIHKELGLFDFTSNIVAKHNPAIRSFIESKEELQHLAGCA